MMNEIDNKKTNALKYYSNHRNWSQNDIGKYGHSDFFDLFLCPGDGWCISEDALDELDKLDRDSYFSAYHYYYTQKQSNKFIRKHETFFTNIMRIIKNAINGKSK